MPAPDVSGGYDNIPSTSEQHWAKPIINTVPFISQPQQVCVCVCVCVHL